MVGEKEGGVGENGISSSLYEGGGNALDPAGELTILSQIPFPSSTPAESQSSALDW